MTYVSPREQKEEGLTREKLQMVLDRLLVPYVSRVESTSPDVIDDTGDFHAMAGRPVLTRDGRTVTPLFEMWRGDDGTNTNVLHQVLVASWMIRFGRFDGPHQPAQITRIALQGLSQDTEFLRSIGLPGATPADPSKPFRDWSAMSDNCHAIIARADASNARS